MEFIFKSDKIAGLMKYLDKAAATDATVLVQGESGTGKELISRAIHNKSKRAEKPYVTLNCGAVPEALLESELFGYKKGAFTGADTDKPGLVKSADGGSLFMDEIGEISLEVQKKLLRFLQEKEYLPLGAKSSETANVRIIAATNRDLEADVEAKCFRQDLFFRLNTLTLEIPALRERKEDLPLFFNYFLNKYDAADYVLDEKLIKKFNDYSWPGNVRELENLIQRLIIFADNKVLKSDHLPPYFNKKSDTSGLPGAFSKENFPSLKEMEQIHINNALNLFESRKEAAHALGISMKTLYNKSKLDD